MPKSAIRFIASSCIAAERFAQLAPAVGEKAQRPLGGDGRILLAKRPRGRIAWVGEDLAARRFLPFVQGLEIRLGHVDLAAHLDKVGRAGNVMRNVKDRADVRSDVLAGGTIATGRS